MAAPLGVDEARLAAVGHVADRLLAGQPVRFEGPRKHRRGANRGVEFLDFQPYSPGSDLRHIDWRASRRGRDLLVRRYVDELAAEWWICIDASASMSIGGAAKWTLAAQVAVAFAYLLLRRNSSVGVMAFSNHVDALCPAGRGRHHFGQVASLLARHAPRTSGGESDPSACLDRLRPRRSVLLISDFLVEDGMRSALRRLVGFGGAVHGVQILSDSDRPGPAGREHFVRDIETGERIGLGESGATDLVAERLARAQSELRDRCAKLGVPLTQAETSQTWISVVIAHLTAVGGARG